MDGWIDLLVGLEWMERLSCWLAQHYTDDSTDGQIGLLVGTKSQ